MLEYNCFVNALVLRHDNLIASFCLKMMQYKLEIRKKPKGTTNKKDRKEK